MLEQAVRLLAEAKGMHDQLEKCYAEAMDFDKVNAVADRTLEKYRQIIEKYTLSQN